MLGFGITLSVYLSDRVRDVAGKILKGEKTIPVAGDLPSLFYSRAANWLILVILDITLWINIILPITILNYIWFQNLSPTTPIYTDLRKWVSDGFTIIVCLLAFAHLLQASFHAF